MLFFPGRTRVWILANICSRRISLRPLDPNFSAGLAPGAQWNAHSAGRGAVVIVVGTASAEAYLVHWYCRDVSPLIFPHRALLRNAPPTDRWGPWFSLSLRWRWKLRGGRTKPRTSTRSSAGLRTARCGPKPRGEDATSACVFPIARRRGSCGRSGLFRSPMPKPC